MDDDEAIGNERRDVEDEEQPPAAPELNQEDQGDDQDDQDNNQEVMEEEPDFAEICSRIFRNDRNVTKYITPPVMSDNDVARLSVALYCNTNLKTLDVTLGPPGITMFESITTRGALMLGNAIQHSKIESITLLCMMRAGERGAVRDAEAPPDVAPILFQKAIKTVTSVDLMFSPTEAEAIKIKEALLMTDNTSVLKKLALHVPGLTPAIQLGAWRRGSRARPLHQSTCLEGLWTMPIK
jgi:hypothetical protein